MSVKTYVDVSPAEANAVLLPDGSAPVVGVGLPGAPWHKEFTVPSGGVGASLSVDALGYSGTARRVIIPAGGGELQKPTEQGGGSAGPIDLQPSHGDMRLHVDGEYFYRANGSRWTWKGSTDLYLAARLDAGEDIRPILDQRQNAGANLVRSLAQIDWAWLPFWGLMRPTYWESVHRYFSLLQSRGLWCEWTVLAGTRGLMPLHDQQVAFWEETKRVAAAYPAVLLELCNEWNHSSQTIDPAGFVRPTANLASHGSGLTDAPPVQPEWDFATYHARRDVPPDGRGFTNYDCFEFQARWPRGNPAIPDEGIKPDAYGFNTAWARMMGKHAGINAGGTFHCGAGVDSVLWAPDVESCARAFYEGVDGK